MKETSRKRSTQLTKVLCISLRASADATELQNERTREQQAGPKPKELDILFLYNLLGWANLKWEDRDQLATVWTEIAQKPTKALERHDNKAWLSTVICLPMSKRKLRHDKSDFVIGGRVSFDNCEGIVTMMLSPTLVVAKLPVNIGDEVD